MKKIDLTVVVGTTSTILKQFVNNNKTTQEKHPLLANFMPINSLQRYVVNALMNYTECDIASAPNVVKLANSLKETPICVITDDDFSLIESALAKSTANVKAAWFEMVQINNTEE